MNEMQLEILNNLKSITSDCRDDMHEPDEQGIKARVIGNKLDNAMGNAIIPEAIKQGWQELVVIISDDKGNQELFNLADIIALARKAQL